MSAPADTDGAGGLEDRHLLRLRSGRMGEHLQALLGAPGSNETVGEVDRRLVRRSGSAARLPLLEAGPQETLGLVELTPGRQQPTEMHLDERSRAVIRRSQHPHGVAQHRLRLVEASLVHQHLTDVRFAHRGVEQIADAPVGLDRLAVPLERLVPPIVEIGDDSRGCSPCRPVPRDHRPLRTARARVAPTPPCPPRPTAPRRGRSRGTRVRVQPVRRIARRVRPPPSRFAAPARRATAAIGRSPNRPAARLNRRRSLRRRRQRRSSGRATISPSASEYVPARSRTLARREMDLCTARQRRRPLAALLGVGVEASRTSRVLSGVAQRHEQTPEFIVVHVVDTPSGLDRPLVVDDCLEAALNVRSARSAATSRSDRRVHDHLRSRSAATASQRRASSVLSVSNASPASRCRRARDRYARPSYTTSQTRPFLNR